jgi:hypothetical protein
MFPCNQLTAIIYLLILFDLNCDAKQACNTRGVTPPRLAWISPRQREQRGAERRWLRRCWIRETEQRPPGVRVGAEGDALVVGRRRAAALCSVGGGEAQGGGVVLHVCVRWDLGLGGSGYVEEWKDLSVYLSTKSGRQSTEGMPKVEILLVDRCASYELDGDARHNKVFIQVRPP